MNKKYLKDFALLCGIVVICALIARYMAHGQTLEEYGKEKAAAAATASVESTVSTTEANIEASTADSTTEANTSASITDASSYSSSEATAEVTTESTESTSESQRVTYMDGFYYEPLSQEIIDKITGISYTENDNISLEDLRYCKLLYNDFSGNVQMGELICNESIAQDVMEIFYELYSSGYQIESIKLIDEFDGDDTASMLANNTSCFNYRVVEGSTRLSNHAYGLAIDLNPFYNPYITYNKDGSQNISPEGSEAYADRSASFPYKIDENDLAYKLFKEHGFKWGGDWNSVKDYQHFERSN